MSNQLDTSYERSSDRVYLEDVRQLTENNPYQGYRNDFHMTRIWETRIIPLPPNSFIVAAEEVIKMSKGFGKKRPVKVK